MRLCPNRPKIILQRFNSNGIDIAWQVRTLSPKPFALETVMIIRRTQRRIDIMMLSLSFRALLVAVLFLILSIAVLAQSTATLQGTVTDQKGAVVPNATVIVRNQATSIERNVQTDNSGNYQVAALPAGAYSVEVQAQGFKSPARDAPPLLAGPVLVEKFHLPNSPVVPT